MTTRYTRPLLGGRYEFVKSIGKGGFGLVEQYTDIITNTSVAIKTIPSTGVDQESKRLVREIDILLHLFQLHPHVMSFTEVFVTLSSSSIRSSRNTGFSFGLDKTFDR